MTLNSNIINIYYNGTLKGSSTISQGPRIVNRTLNYIGLERFNTNNPNSNAKIDDLKIFNRSLIEQKQNCLKKRVRICLII